MDNQELDKINADSFEIRFRGIAHLLQTEESEYQKLKARFIEEEREALRLKLCPSKESSPKIFKKRPSLFRILGSFF